MSLLINPRPTDLSFSRFSFPSKTSEYMLSGTPILTTRISGIPQEYDEFLNYIDDESYTGIARCIKNILSDSNRRMRYEKAQLARDFITKKKNKNIQTKKIVELLNRVSSKDIK